MQFKPLKFYTITFLITWFTWFLTAYLSHQEQSGTLYSLLLIPGLLAPFGTALWLTWKNKGLKREFFSKLFNIKRLNPSTLPLMLVVMPVVVLLSITLSLLFGLSAEQFHFSDRFSFNAGVFPVFLMLFLAASFEELGWRGYAIESLEDRYSYFTATLIFGVLWAFWHFPLFFIKDYYQYTLYQENVWYAVNFMVSVIPIAFIISWMYHLNRESILLAILFHFVINLSQEALQMEPQTKCIETGLLTLLAVVLVLSNKQKYFKKSRSGR